MKIEWRRKIIDDEILRFAELSGDKGSHHLERDPQGRLMAHGLLTATLPTKLGGDLDFIARTMHFEFLKAVYGGDELTCRGIIESVIAQSTRLKVKFLFEITNQLGELVLKGDSAGQILRKP
ncbi:MAG: dehydratase [Elusimicrobia bacterium]|nr:dehydratase [Elusimicrobiota bacterium]